MKKKVLISIITATHNRASYIKDLYNSLKKQSFKDFEWVVGNDGSDDNTDILIKKYIKEKKIRIKYVFSNIRIGKTKIDNLIIHVAKWKYRCYCGSDDYLKPDALKKMSNLLKKIPKKIMKNFHGIVTECVDENNESQSFYENKKPLSNKFIKWEDIKKFTKGDSLVLEKSAAYKYKKFKEVDFLISESTLMNKIHSNKLFLLTKVPTLVMRRAKNSISFGKIMRFNRGYAHSIAINSNYKKFKNYNLKKKILTVALYWRYCFHGDIAFKAAKKMWDVTKNNNIYLFCIALSFIYLIWDLTTKKIEKTHIEFNKNKIKAKITYFN